MAWLTSTFDSNGFVALGKRGKGGGVAPIEGSILKAGKESLYNLASTFDGRTQFQLSKY